MRIVYHLGTYKTGTSSFQNLMYRNHDLLRSNGVLYPRFGLSKDGSLGRRHAPLVYDFLAGKAPALPDLLFESIVNSDCDTIVLSSEAWSSARGVQHLARLVTSLIDRGINEHLGVLTLRNLECYQISHYREFTVNQKNADSYPVYLRKNIAIFDYLSLVRGFRSLFGNGLQVISFEDHDDILQVLFESIGAGVKFKALKMGERANVKSVSPLEVEAKRCANFLKMSKSAGVDALRNLIEASSDMQSEIWTERFKGDVPDLPQSYMRQIAEAAGFDDRQKKALFEVSPVIGRSVSEFTGSILEALQRMDR